MTVIDTFSLFNISLPFQHVNSQNTEIIAKCPFHAGTRKDTFNISIESGLFYCFSCGARGNLEQFTRLYTQLSDSQIADRLHGKKLPLYKQAKPSRDKHLSEIELDVISQYALGLHNILMGKYTDTVPGLKPVTRWNKYLSGRGITQEAIEHFKLGAAGAVPNYSNYFCECMLKRGYRDIHTTIREDLHLYNRRGSDFWYSPAVTIPYMYDGQAYFINARLLPGARLKYMSLPGIKREVFLNDDCLDNYDTVFVVEGELNAISMWAAGIKNVMSFGGKQQFNENLVNRLYGYEVILYFDTDKEDIEFKARQEAINKLADIAKSVSYFELPVDTDINDYLKEHSLKEFEDNILANTINVPELEDWQPGEYRILAEAERKTVISLSEAQKITSEALQNVAENFKGYSGLKLLINTPVGTGKTRAAISLINSLKPNRALVLTNYHYLANEYKNSLDVDFTTCHLKGRGHTDIECPYFGLAEQMARRGYALKFKLTYCGKYGKCEKKDTCRYKDMVEQARSSEVLLATHAHGQLRDFMVNPYYGNSRRRLIIIDEQADLIKQVVFTRQHIAYNIHILEKVIQKATGEALECARGLLQAWGILNSARIARQGCKLPYMNYSGGVLYELDYLIACIVPENETRAWKLYDIAYAQTRGIVFNYFDTDTDRDSLYYLWKAAFPKKACVIFMSATAHRRNIEQILGISIDRVIGEDFLVKRENLQVIQLLGAMGGRNRLLYSSDRQSNVKAVFRGVLSKHREKRIIIITSMGAGLVDTDLFSTAKQRVMDMLKPIAETFNKKLISVSTGDIEARKVPDNINEIPVIHYGIRGTNIFYNYDILIELTAHYYSENQIIDGVLKEYNIDISNSRAELKPCIFRTWDKEYITEKYIHPDNRIREYVEAHQEADLVQTEGRVLRGEDTEKYIYRLHNVNIYQYPDRVYKTWAQLIKAEFGTQELKGKLLEVWNWICENVPEGKTFTSGDIIQALGGHRQHINSRYLSVLAKQGHILKTSKVPGKVKYHILNNHR